MRINVLNTLKAKSLPAGKWSDGQGLWLVKRSKERGKWVLRFSLAGHRREMGMGSWPDTTLAEARERAVNARCLVRDGLDPITERNQRRAKANRLTVAEAIDGCFAARRAELKRDGKAGRWLSPLSKHIIPRIGSIAIEDVDQHILKDTLEPIWHSKASTADKALSRINITLKYAAAIGLNVDLQAPMKTRALLGKQRHIVQHIKSMPYDEVPAFYQWLTTQHTVSALALRFLILTVKRTSEIRFATYDEIDGAVWTIPAERMKWPVEHRVPLTDEALRVIELTKQFEHSSLLFPTHHGKPMSDMAMSKFMTEHDYLARPHGFRSSFRTWCEEQTDASYDVKEACLAHKVDMGVVAAYQRSDRFERRRALLENWCSWVKK